MYQWLEGVGCDARRNVTVFVQEIVIIGVLPRVVVTFNVKVRAVIGPGVGSERPLGFLFHASDYGFETKQKSTAMFPQAARGIASLTGAESLAGT